MERRAQEFRNFVSHFIHIQIFQREISSFSLILIAPKYSRQIYRGRNEHILIFLFNFTAKYKKKRDELNSFKYFTQETGAQIFAKHNFQPSNLNFTMKSDSSNNAILSFFSQRGLYFYPTKDRCLTSPTSTLLYICCNFGQIFCTNLIQIFSVQNMGHDQLKKCSKYYLVSLLDEKQRSTFDIF